MGLKDNAKALIDANVYANGQEQITGQGLNATLKGIVDILPTTEEIVSGIKGVATTSTVPSATGFERWLVHEAGTYTNFSGIVVSADDLDVVSGVANNRVILEVSEGVATKRVERVKGDTGADGIGVTDYIASFENLIDPNQTTQSGYFEGTGVVTGSPNYRAGTDIYPVNIGDKFWVKNIFTLQFLDASMNVMSSTYASTYTVDGVLTIPSYTGSGWLTDVAFMRVSTQAGATAFADGLVGLGLGDVAPISAPAYGEDYAEPKESLMAGIQDTLVLPTPVVQDIHMIEFDNLINPEQATQQGAFAGASIIDVGVDFRVGLDYYEAKVGDKFVFAELANFQAYTSSKNAIYADAIVNYTVDGVFTVPANIGGVSLANTEFIRVGSASGADAFSSGKTRLVIGDVKPSYLPDYGQEYTEPDSSLILGISKGLGNISSPLKGKTLLLLSDSIGNHPQSFAVQLCQKHGATFVKRSQDGAWISHPNPNPDPTNIKFFLSEEYLNLPLNNPDVILIAAGTNDINITGWESRLGTMADRTNDTFYGALHVLLAGLITRYVDARIGFLAPIPSSIRYIDGDLTNLPYVKYKAIKEVCAHYAIPVWNGNTEFGRSALDSTEWRNKYMPDLTHPNTLGHGAWYMPRVEDFVLNLAK